jgi:tetratricopeptide (TPR) repeat protein
MKFKQIIVVSSLLVSVASFAQKDELKALKKIYGKEEITALELDEYKNLISKAIPLATDEGDKIYIGFYKSMIPILEMGVLALDKSLTPLQVQMKTAKAITPKTIAEFATGLNATLEYEKKTGKKIQTTEIQETITNFKPMLINMAVALGEQKKYKEAAEILYSTYVLDKKDQDKLYYASSYAINGSDYVNALKYLKELKEINYSGERTMYYAKNLANGNEDSYDSKIERDNLVKLKTHILPREAKEPSKRGEIMKNIALILVQEGKNDEAKEAIVEARKNNPDDKTLLLTEADLYYKLNDIPNYKRLISEALNKNPNDTDLLFNLGVVSGNSNDITEAEKYYIKVIEIDPNYINAYLNLADLKLKPDAVIVEQMNKLGTSAADMKKYDALKAERQRIFNEAMPILEKAHQLKEDDQVVKSNLMSVYKYLELNDTDKYKALKAKM